MNKICGGDKEGKIYHLMDCTERPSDVADPWYTGCTDDIDVALTDVNEGCGSLLESVKI